MHVKQLELYNFQGIKHFEGSFEGNVYLVTGENELGKSTLLRAITVLLTGSRDEVLRNDAEKGFAKAIIGDDGQEFEVKLSMTKANPRGTLTIKSQDGMFSDRLSMLQQVFGYTDFDATEFSAWSETAEGRRKQVEMVKSLLPTHVQQRIVEIDMTVKGIRDSRKDDNAKLREYTTLASSKGSKLKIGDAKKYAAPVDMDSLISAQREAAALEQKAHDVAQKRKEREAAVAEFSERRRIIEYEYKKRIAELDAAEKENAEKLQNCEEWLADYAKTAPVSVAEQLAAAKEHNEIHAVVKEYTEAESKRSQYEKAVAAHDEKVQSLLAEREELVTNSQLPIPNLTFTEDGLVLGGVPFENDKVSDSQIMEVAARIIIAKNPTVKVFRIGRGESLGAKKLKALVEFAQANGYQGFIEQVKRGQDDLRVEEYSEKEE